MSSLGSPNPLLIGGAAKAYEIEKSLRFNSDDSPYLNKTWSGDDADLQKQTYSFWFKRKKQAQGYFFTAWNNSNTDRIGILSDSQFFIELKNGSSTEAEFHSKRVLRDESAWYHAVVAFDTTQGTTDDRIKVWINGVLITDWDTKDTIGQDYSMEGFGRANKQHVIGAYASGSSSQSGHFDGYMTEFYFIDGQQLTASSFGEINEKTGQWVPIKYTGTYGSKGWYINFSDSSTLGKDYSGNSQDFTPSNLSVSAGIGNDSFIDTPTNNFMNMMSDSRLNCTISEGGMKMVTTGSNVTSYSTFQIPTSGKYYFECKMTTTAETMLSFDSKPRISVAHTPPGDDGDFTVYIYAGSYEIYYGGSSVTSGTMGHGAGTVYQFWVDRDNHTLKVGRDDEAQSFTWTFPAALRPYPLAVGRCHTTTWNAGTWEWYFGGNGFIYDPGDTWKTLSTANLPDPIIAKGTDHFGTFNYNGDVSTTTRNVTGLDFNPDLIILQRHQTAGGGHTHVYDTNRGMGANKEFLMNSASYKEGDENGATYGYVDEHTGDGSAGAGGVKIVKGSDSNYGNNSFNYDGGVFNILGWLGGGSTETTNDSGDITSSVSANQTAGFSIVTYTGSGTAGDTVGHGLGVAPEFIMTKNRDYADTMTGVGPATDNAWGYELYPGQNNAGSSNNNAHNGTAATSTVYSLGGGNVTNRSGDKIVAYCFSSVAGYSRFGTYIGNGDTDGPYIYLGFRPQLFVTKRMDTSSHWYVWEDANNPYNQRQFVRWWNLTSGAETHTAYGHDAYASGIKIRNSESDTNTNGYHCFFMAFAKSPFKYSNAH